MSNYIFHAHDISICSEYGSCTLLCTPHKCKIIATSDDNVILYETEIIPLIYGNFNRNVIINIWDLISEYSVVELTNKNEFILDNIYHITTHEVKDVMVSRIPGSVIITKIPKQLLDFKGEIVFEREQDKRDVFITLDCEKDIKIKLDTIYINGPPFETSINSTYIHDYISDDYIKIYLETCYPLCIEDGSNRTYIAPCQK